MLVHSGDLHGGHYFACIKPDAASRWLKFDDDRVTPVTDREVLEENYGGEVLNGVPPTLQRNQVRSMKRFSNAYMLVYIRESLTEDVLPPFKEEDTPAHLSERYPGHMLLSLIASYQKGAWMRSVCRSRQNAVNAKNNIFSSQQR